MIDKRNENLALIALNKACHRLLINQEELLVSLSVDHYPCAENYCHLTLQEQNYQALVKLLSIFNYIEHFCCSDIKFIRHWFTSDNKQLSEKPIVLIYSKAGIEQLYDYCQSFNLANPARL